MKVHTLIISFIFFCIHCQAQQAKDSDTAVEAQIRAIRVEFTKINSDSLKLKMVIKDIMDESTEGGEIRKFYDGRELRRAILIYFGEMGQSRSEYYFLNGHLIFLFDQLTNYSKPFYMKGYKISRIDEDRYYFYNGKLIRWLRNNGRKADRSRYPAKGKEILGNLKKVCIKAHDC